MKQKVNFLFTYIIQDLHTLTHTHIGVRVKLKDQYKYIFIMDGSESKKIIKGDVEVVVQMEVKEGY